MKEDMWSAGRKLSGEKIYSRKEVRALLNEKQRDIDALRNDLKKAFAQLVVLEKQNKALKQRLAETENPGDGYRRDWTWVRKIIFVLEKAGRPLRSAEIIEELAKREQHLREHWNQAKYFSAFLKQSSQRRTHQPRKKKRRTRVLLHG